MVEQVETEGAKVEEGGDDAPVLALEENCAHAVEELVRRDEFALNRDAGAQSSRHPPAGADGHLVEPLLEGEAAHEAVASG